MHQRERHCIMASGKLPQVGVIVTTGSAGGRRIFVDSAAQKVQFNDAIGVLVRGRQHEFAWR